MERARSDPQDAITRAIARYVAAHPEAKDTVEGVMKWWLPEKTPGCGREEVEAGLGSLVARGWILERVIAPGRRIYCANRDRVAEMKAFADRE